MMKVELDLLLFINGSLLPTFIQICESIVKKCPESECDGQMAITHEKVGRP